MALTTRDFLILALAVALFACDGKDSNAKPTDSVEADKWLGQWNGPEGSFLRLAGGSGHYDITIQNLDGPRLFKGAAVGDRIAFDRNGVTESIRATDGKATGMKWLADKKDCLTIKSGEGYCRD